MGLRARLFYRKALRKVSQNQGNWTGIVKGNNVIVLLIVPRNFSHVRVQVENGTDDWGAEQENFSLLLARVLLEEIPVLAPDAPVRSSPLFDE